MEELEIIWNPKLWVKTHGNLILMLYFTLCDFFFKHGIILGYQDSKRFSLKKINVPSSNYLECVIG